MEKENSDQISLPALPSAPAGKKWSEWKLWEGNSVVGPISLKEGEYLVQFRNHTVHGHRDAKNWRWDYKGTPYDIVRYKIAVPLEEGDETGTGDDWGPWVEWVGRVGEGKGEVDLCPIPDRKKKEYQIRLRAYVTLGDLASASDFRWSHRGSSGDIVAYRVKKKFMTTPPQTERPLVKRVRRAPGQAYGPAGLPVDKENAAMIKRDGEPLPKPPEPTPAPSFMVPGFKMPAPRGLMVLPNPGDKYEAWKH